jgi:ferritin-like metal-binding protein YciE
MRYAHWSPGQSSGRNDCASLLKQNLEEEAATDEQLAKLATDGIYRTAA